ncbi:MAG: transcription termination/antitermination protein NusA [Lachnospiraceae bacterium]|nr:transcription termination/antitermination protein NusA [Lachnospiraceae bacterium]
MSAELKEAIEMIAREKNISKNALLDGIEQSLLQACKNHFGKADNVVVEIDRDTCDYQVYSNKTVVETVEDPALEMSLLDAKKKDEKYEIGDTVRVPIESKSFGRIATQNAKNVILQKIREEERKSLFERYYEREHQIISGTVSRINERTITINLGKTDGILTESESVKSENLRVHDRVKVYVLEVKDSPKGPRIMVSRSHPELVKKLFESEVSELAEGVVEIKAIAREAGSRTKLAVLSHDADVDAVGACVGMNGIRVGAVVDELGGEKVDIINWDDNPALLIENALSPAKVISVLADPDDKTALVIVPDYQLSLAIGKEGQNARLAAKLTGFKIDIKSETQAQEAGIFEEYFGEDYDDEEEEDDYYLEPGEDGEEASEAEGNKTEEA